TLTLKGDHKLVTSVCFSPNGQRLASASGDLPRAFRPDLLKGPVKDLTLKDLILQETQTGKDLFKGQPLSGGVKVWDTQTGRVTPTLKGHTAIVTSVAFSSDGQRLASASLDGTVKVWDAQTGQEVLTLKGQTQTVLRLTTSVDFRNNSQ